MAKNVAKKDITQRNMPTRSVPGIQENSDSEAIPTNRPERMLPFRGFGSNKSIFIILAWTYIMTCCLHLREKMSKEYVSQSGKDIPQWLVQFNSAIHSTALGLSCPIASLLAEVVIGRYKFISYTLKAQWLLFLFGAVLSVGEYYLQIASSTSYMTGNYLVSVPASAIQGAFIAVVVPFGLDQISGGSNRNISAFIVWFLWSLFSAYSTGDILAPVFYSCTRYQRSEIYLIISLIQVILLSVGLILDFGFHHNLIKEPVTVNPVSLIFKVLKYAAKHKYPVQRSAFTYCENEQPTRLDYGKSKYGGPFTTEQVEDVKTFWRLLLVNLAISMLYAPTESMYASYPDLKSQFRSDFPSNCIQKVTNGGLTLSSFTTYSIPLYELLIYPCLRNRSPTILQSSGIGAVATISASLYGILIEGTRQVTTNGTIECMFLNTASNKSQIPFYIAVPLSYILGFTVVVLYKARIKLVCAQAPYNMNSLLIGISFLLQALFRVLGIRFHDSWGYKWFRIPFTSTCGIWFYLTNLVAALAISLLLSFIVRWYKARERDDIIMSQMMVEEIYYKYRDQDRQT